MPPGGGLTFFCFAKRKSAKKRRPHCLRPLRFATGQPAVLAAGGVSLELASLRQSRALIRQPLRSSAHTEGTRVNKAAAQPCPSSIFFRGPSEAMARPLPSLLDAPATWRWRGGSCAACGNSCFVI